MSVVVVGGGVAGLVAARDLAVAGHEVLVLEAAGEVGGTVRGHDVAGLRLDAGAESFATRTSAVADLVAELGLEVVPPSGAQAWVHSAAGSVPLPATGVLGIPARPWDRDVRHAVGPVGAARAALDRVLPHRHGRPDGPVSLGALVRARMGGRVVDRLVAPVVAGVHSTSVDDLDVGAVPGLRDAVVRHGSLGAAVGAMRAAAPAGSAVAGVRGGVHRVVEQLAADVVARGGRVRTGTVVERLRRADGGWEVTVRTQAGARVLHAGAAPVPDPAGASSTHRAGAVVVATDAAAAHALLLPLVDDVPALPPQDRVDLVTLVLDAPALDAAPRGTGVLVAPGTHGVRAKALTHATAKWPWLADAAGGRHVVRLSYGGAGHAGRLGDDVPDDDAAHVALDDAAALLGVPLPPARLVGHARVTWRSGLPARRPGQGEEIARLRAAVGAVPGLAVVGAWVAGTGLAAVVPDARRGAAGLNPE